MLQATTIVTTRATSEVHTPEQREHPTNVCSVGANHRDVP